MTAAKDTGNGLKRILVGAAAMIVAALFVQSGALLWWAGGMDARMERAERDLTTVCQRVHNLEQK